MIPWVVIDRRHLRHSTPMSSSQRLLVTLISRLSPKSLPHNLFADPHPLNPIASIFYKKGGGRGLPDVQIEAPPALWSGDPHRVGTFQCVSELSPFFSNHCALFCTREKLNSFVFKRFRTLCKKPPGVGVGGQR